MGRRLRNPRKQAHHFRVLPHALIEWAETGMHDVTEASKKKKNQGRCILPISLKSVVDFADEGLRDFIDGGMKSLKTSKSLRTPQASSTSTTMARENHRHHLLPHSPQSKVNKMKRVLPGRCRCPGCGTSRDRQIRYYTRTTRQTDHCNIGFECV